MMRAVVVVAALAAVGCVVDAINPTSGSGALEQVHDIELTVAPSDAGLSQLDFLLLGDEGVQYALANFNNGTMRLTSGDKTLFEIEDEASGVAYGEQVLLQESQSEFLSRVHQARLRARHARRASARTLLSSSDGEQAKLVKAIRASGEVHVAGVVASTASGNVFAHGHRQWKMVVHEDFHQDNVEGWENKGEDEDLPPNNAISECSSKKHTYSDFFLGVFTKMDTSKSFVLPVHTHVRIQARVHFIDNWSGDSVYLKVGDGIVWTRSHRWCAQLLETICRPRHLDDPDDKGLTIHVCGDPNYPDQLSVPLDVTFAHSAEDISLTFGSNVQVPGATWGVDDVIISVI